MLVVDQDNCMVIITSFRADVMYWVDVENYIEWRSVRDWRRYVELRAGFKILGFFCRNTIAYNHQHPSMATCFGLFYVIFRPILIYNIQVKIIIKIPYNWHIYYEGTFITCGPRSSVGIATGYELDGPGIESRWGRDFPHLSRLALRPHPASCSMGTGSFPG